MKKIFLAASLIFFLFPAYLYPFQANVLTDRGLIRIKSEYRRLSQGEPLKISLSSSGLSSAKAHFDGKNYTFVSSRAPSTFFLLIGLGLYIRPGIHDLKVQIEFKDGQRGNFSFKIPVSNGRFRLKKLNVDRRFTSHSTEVQKRILKEAKLTRAVYDECIPMGLFGQGKFIIPVKGMMKRNFGERRIFNDNFLSRHRGIDILSPAGMPVRASNSGKVSLACDLYYSGNTIIINHGMGLFSIYCHLSKICAVEGKQVDRGEIIGYTGSSGRVTGPHLHWGFRLFDKYVDPLSVVYLSFD